MKNLDDFPDLINYFENLTIKHFEDGLNINSIIKNSYKDYYLTANGHKIFFDKEDETHLIEVLLNKIKFNTFTKENFLSLFRNNKIDPIYLVNMMFRSISDQKLDVLKFLIENNVVDVNIKSKQGYTLLMCTRDEEIIKYLFEKGCDINSRVTDINSIDFNQTVYEMALKTKKKYWINILKPYLKEGSIENYTNSALVEFKNEKNIKNQFKLCIYAIKENNNEIINEIINNQNNYQELIKFVDSHNRNLIIHTIINNSEEILRKLLTLEYYQKNKLGLKINEDMICYTEEAISRGKNVLAKILYTNGFRNDETLITFFKQYYYDAPDILNLMIDNGFKPTLSFRIKNHLAYKLEEESFTAEDLNVFFRKNQKYLNLEELILYFNGKSVFLKEKTIEGNYVNIKSNTIKIFSILINKQKELDIVNFEKNFKHFLGSLGKNQQKIALRYANIFIKEFDEIDKERLLSCLGTYERRDWLITLNKEKLEQLLLKIEKNTKEEIKHPKRINI